MASNNIELDDLRPIHIAPTGGPANERQYHGFPWVVICALLYLPCFLCGLNTTIAAAVQGSMIESLGHVEQFSWIGAGFSLGSVCVFLLLRALYNTFNMKWTFIVSGILFEFGSAMCGTAEDMVMLIVGRVITGAGATGVFIGSQRYLINLTTENEQNYYLFLGGVFWASGRLLGPLIGGALAGPAGTWRWISYINLVTGVPCGPAFAICLPSTVCPLSGGNMRERLAGIDLVGFVLGSGMWISYTLALMMAGGQWSWSDGRPLGTMVACLLLLVLYVLQQYFAVFTTPTKRAFPGRLLRHYTQVLLFIVTAAEASATSILIYYLPIYFRFVSKESALTAGMSVMPFMISNLFFNGLSECLLIPIKYYKLLYLFAATFILVGSGPWIQYLNPDAPAVAICGLAIVTGMGCGISMGTGYFVSTLTTNPEDKAAAQSLQNVAQIGGQVVSLGIASQIYKYCAVANLNSVLAGQGYSSSEILEAMAGVQSTLFQGLEGTLRNQAIDAIARAMQMTFLIVPIAGGVMLFAALVMKFELLFDDNVISV